MNLEQTSRTINFLSLRVLEIELNPHHPDGDDIIAAYEIVIDELVHIEQYFEGRLNIKSERFFSIYEGQKVRLVSNKSAEYNQLPWEQEAIIRAAKLVNIVYK